MIRFAIILIIVSWFAPHLQAQVAQDRYAGSASRYWQQQTFVDSNVESTFSPYLMIEPHEGVWHTSRDTVIFYDYLKKGERISIRSMLSDTLSYWADSTGWAKIFLLFPGIHHYTDYQWVKEELCLWTCGSVLFFNGYTEGPNHAGKPIGY